MITSQSRKIVKVTGQKNVRKEKRKTKTDNKSNKHAWQKHRWGDTERCERERKCNHTLLTEPTNYLYIFCLVDILEMESDLRTFVEKKNEMRKSYSRSRLYYLTEMMAQKEGKAPPCLLAIHLPTTHPSMTSTFNQCNEQFFTFLSFSNCQHFG
tara:strand:+ start:776 stop:1237 length:462 start_codon:yes stop_codon:yes gene_type:complete